MAQASHKKFGAGQQDQGKGDGSGGMSEAEPENPSRTEVLSNRDTSRHSEQRGLDSRHVKTEQLHDHVANQSTPAADEDKLADERPDEAEAGKADRDGK